jgi:hypothetical protein
MRKLHRIYWIVLIALAAAVGIKGVVQDADERTYIWVAILFAIGAVLGWLTFFLAKLPMLVPMRGVMVLVVGYHALFGPIMLAYMLMSSHSRNEDLPLQLYPHVIHFIDSLE